MRHQNIQTDNCQQVSLTFDKYHSASPFELLKEVLSGIKELWAEILRKGKYLYCKYKYFYEKKIQKPLKRKK